jgi:hypothetical protein
VVNDAPGSTGILDLAVPQAASNTYNETTTVFRGTLQVDSDNDLGAPSASLILGTFTTIEIGTLLTTGANFTSTRLIILEPGGAGGTINTGGHSDTLSGPISDTSPSLHGSLTATGGGCWPSILPSLLETPVPHIGVY